MTGYQLHSDATQESFEPRSDATRAANLHDREKQLTEQLRLASDASYRRRVEIEEELSEIRRQLERLGLPPPA